jgi:lipopolysaccharide export system ATP-binding protein
METAVHSYYTAASETTTRLIAQDLHKRYGRREVVRGVSFEVSRGEIVALFGPNGAGKTTSFYMMVGFVEPTTGQISIGGQNVTKLPMYKRARLGLGYLPQEPSAFRRMTALENLLAVLEFQKLSKTERTERAMSLLEELGITHLKDKFAYTLSGGERRRLEIARCLCTNPDFILLDEPFTGVDPKNVHDIQHLIFELRQRRGVGIFITDHSVRETVAIADRIYLMAEGKTVFHGTPEQFAEDNEVRVHYLGQDYKL